MRRSERTRNRSTKPSAPFALPSAPVDGTAVTNLKALVIAGFPSLLPRPSTGSLPGARSARTTPAQARKQHHCTPSSTLEAASTIKGSHHSSATHTRDGANGRPHVRAGRQVGTPTLVGTALDAEGLVSGRPLHPLAGRRVELEHRQRLLRGSAVHALHLAVGRRPVVSEPCLAARAALPGLAGVAA